MKNEILEEKKESRKKLLNYYNITLELNNEIECSKLDKIIQKRYSEDINLLKFVERERKKFFEMGFYFSIVKA